MKTTTFYLPEAVEALIADTRRATVEDARIADVIARGHTTRDGESPIATACRAFAPLLPEMGDGLRTHRCTYGWTEEEIRRIVLLLYEAAAELRGLRAEAPLSGTRVTLERDAERCRDIARLWAPQT